MQYACSLLRQLTGPRHSDLGSDRALSQDRTKRGGQRGVGVRKEEEEGGGKRRERKKGRVFGDGPGNK